MKRGRQSNWRSVSGAIDRTAHASIDLGLELSVYGRNADGRFVEIGRNRGARPLRGMADWPTEQ